MSDTARILDRGYRHYNGERRGVRGAMRSVVLESIKRVLGIRRSFWAKLVPILTAFIAYVPAIVFVGLAVLIPDEILDQTDTASYAGYYGFITAALILFSAFVGPEVLCPDRRTGMLGLYLASPLNRDTYLLAKAAAVALVLAIVTLGPPLLLLIGNTVAGRGPDGPADFLLLLVRMVAAGVAVSALYTALTMAVSAVTTRHAAASAAIIIILLTSGIVANSLIEGAGASEYVALFDLLDLPFALVVRIYGETLDEGGAGALETLPTAAVVGAYLAWTVLLALFVRVRYQRLDVSR
jgi:ABC-2 type transport system permease protein